MLHCLIETYSNIPLFAKLKVAGLQKLASENLDATKLKEAARDKLLDSLGTKLLPKWAKYTDDEVTSGTFNSYRVVVKPNFYFCGQLLPLALSMNFVEVSLLPYIVL